MSVAVSSRPRITVDGKFFRLGEKKFFVKGVAYGPFPPNARGLPFAAPEQTARDLAQIQELGANVVRVYHVPPRWFLDLAYERQLHVWIDIPWNQRLCFDSERPRHDAREAVRRAVEACARHPAVFAYSVANEIPSDIVRWSGTKTVAGFIDALVAEAKQADPGCLCTFANFPPTEFLRPQNLDFICFNVYLHHEPSFRSYLAHLQIMADSKPLVLGEFGVDSLREGEARQSEMLTWQIEQACRGGLAGAIVFTFTDEWFRDGRLVEDWKMGLVTTERKPRAAFAAVQRAFQAAPCFPPARQPRVSIVVASFNGGRTLKACLDSLQRLNYPDYEIILVDDGSTDTTPEIVSKLRAAGWGERPREPAPRSPDPVRPNRPLPGLTCIRYEKNLGLSAARNTGIAAATGEIVAFTDSDCRADEDWLHYLVADLVGSDFAGIGGPNLLPPDDSRVAAAVMASPGGPAHVMLTDRQAEHVPGCNMAFYKWALADIGGFDPLFTRAGDDVDVCWRLQQAGHKIGFSPPAFVWHYRRSTVAAYLRQQQGYGEAEALLQRKHPENFNAFGSGTWRGRIYTASKFGVELRGPVIYRGQFGSGGFQKLYASEPAMMLMLTTTLEYHLFVTLPLWILALILPYLLPLALAALLIPVGICALAGAQAVLPGNKRAWWSRPLVALLFFVQPVCRGWARYRGRLAERPLKRGSQESLDSIALRDSAQPLHQVQYWAQQGLDRLAFVASILQRLDTRGWPNRSDIGWSEHDVEVYGSRWTQVHLTTVIEEHPGNRRMIRCRLSAVWSPAAKIAFGALLGLELLLIGWLSSWRPWSWFVLLTLPLFVWFQWRDRRNLQSLVVVFLDQLAREQGLIKIQADGRAEPSSASPPADTNPASPAPR